jgi:hypothetical protein
MNWRKWLSSLLPVSRKQLHAEARELAEMMRLQTIALNDMLAALQAMAGQLAEIREAMTWVEPLESGICQCLICRTSRGEIEHRLQ